MKTAAIVTHHALTTRPCRACRERGKLRKLLGQSTSTIVLNAAGARSPSAPTAPSASMWLLLAVASACSSIHTGSRDAVGAHEMTQSSPKGHIFVLNTDVRFIACDSWLCPVDKTMKVEATWQVTAKEVPKRPRGWGSTERCVSCVQRVERAKRGYDHPLPYLTHILGGRSIEELADALHDFLEMAARDLQAREESGAPSRFGRALPLVALPIFGAGLSSDDALRGHDNVGSIIATMLTELDAFTKTHAIDIALCTIDEAAFGAAQTARRKMLGVEEPDQLGRLWRLRPPPNAADPSCYADAVERLAERFLDGQVRCTTLPAPDLDWTDLIVTLSCYPHPTFL